LKPFWNLLEFLCQLNLWVRSVLMNSMTFIGYIWMKIEIDVNWKNLLRWFEKVWKRIHKLKSSGSVRHYNKYIYWNNDENLCL
jgi:hypothetical protein